jgi:hypothetical protein
MLPPSVEVFGKRHSGRACVPDAADYDSIPNIRKV